jgi:RHS repeat-associated protein
VAPATAARSSTWKIRSARPASSPRPTAPFCYDADFYPYGGERPYTNTCPQNYKFEGKERDTETGNDDFGARYYSNGFGRWLSADWSAIVAPVPYANLTVPQTLNLYSMVADDPESFADLDGHNWFTDLFKNVWERNVNFEKYGELVTNAELPVAFARERQWLTNNVAKNGGDVAALQGASNSEINGLYQKWDAAIRASQAERCFTAPETSNGPQTGVLSSIVVAVASRPVQRTTAWILKAS